MSNGKRGLSRNKTLDLETSGDALVELELHSEKRGAGRSNSDCNHIE